MILLRHHQCGDTAHRRLLGIAVASCVLELLAPAMPGRAQTAASAPQPQATQAAADPQSAPTDDAIKQREQELDAMRAQQKSAAEAQEKLKDEAAAIGQDRSKLNQQLIDVASRVRTIETQIGDTEARIRQLDAKQDESRRSLASRRAEVT